MRKRIVVTQRLHREVVDLLSSQADLIVNDSLEVWHRDLLLDFCREAEALMVFMPDSLDAEFLAACPRLKIVAAALKGYDNFDVDACTRLGIWFTIVPDLLTEPTAELAIALLLGLARHVAVGDAVIRSGAFQGWRPILYGQGLQGSTVGIVGLGAVGRALARMLRGFQCRVIYADAGRAEPEIEAALGVSFSIFEDLLAASDFILPLLPLNAGTLHLFGAQTLARMKRGSMLVNVSRGSVVDEEAIASALETGHLAGYAADTFEMEDWARAGRPLDISPRLLALTGHTLFTPHLGSAVASSRFAIESAAASDILLALGGLRPPGAINSLKAMIPRNGARI